MPARTCAFAQACLRTGPSESVPTDREGLLPARTGRLPRNRLTPACSVWRRPRWRFRMLYRPLSTGALERLSSTAGAAIAKREKKSIRQAPTNLPPHQTRGEVWFNCHPPARAGSRSPILVGIYLEAPVLKQTCTHVQVCAQRLFFWTVHRPFSFRLAEKKMGGGLPRHHHGTIFRPIGTAPGGTPYGTAS